MAASTIDVDVIAVSDDLSVTYIQQIDALSLYDGQSEYSTEVKRKDAWRLLLVLLLYAVTGKL